MKRSTMKKILTKSIKSFKDSKNCYLCDTINLTHSNIISPLLKTISQWDTKRSSQINIQDFTCLVCSYNSKCFQKWKTHIMSKEHISMCHILSKVCSYFCKVCKILFYGPENLIYEHQKNVHGCENNLSNISILMSELMNCLDNHSMHIYFCAMCETVSEKKIHTSGKHLTKQTLYYCKYCNATFLCNNEELDFHEASVEHLTFKFIYSIKKGIEVNHLELQKQDKITKITRDICTQIKPLKLPLIILDGFQKTSNSMAKCIICNVNVKWNTRKIVKHINVCLNKDDLTKIHEIHPCVVIKAYECKVCSFYTNSFLNYKLHVISPQHLTNCHASDVFYSYFCTICNLYIYGSKLQINKHLKKKHTKKITDLPFLSEVLKENYKHTSNHPGSNFIDYYSDQQNYKKDLFSVQCNACKISFCMINDYEYKLHMVSSEHIILKYFTQKNPLLMKYKFNYEHLPTSTTNPNFILNKESLNNVYLSSIETDNSNLEETSANKGTNTKKEKLSVSILENKKLFKSSNYGKPHLAISSTTTNHNIQQNGKNVYIDEDDYDISMLDLNSTGEIIFTDDHAQEALHYLNVSMSSDDASQKNIMYNKLENKGISQELFSENTKNIDHTKEQKNILLTESQSNIKTLYKQQQPTDIDQAYGQYVIERLKNIQNLSIKSDIKTEIDALFYTYS